MQFATNRAVCKRGETSACFRSTTTDGRSDRMPEIGRWLDVVLPLAVQSLVGRGTDAVSGLVGRNARCPGVQDRTPGHLMRTIECVCRGWRDYEKPFRLR